MFFFEKKVVVEVYHPICIYALKEATCDTTTTVLVLDPSCFLEIAQFPLPAL